MLINFIRALPLAAVVGASVWGWKWFETRELENKFEELTKNYETCVEDRATLNIAIDNQQETVDSLQEMAERQKRDINRLVREKSAITAERDQALAIFRKHDLTELSRRKPGLIENRINRGTREVFDALEQQTEEKEYEEQFDRFDNFVYDVDGVRQPLEPDEGN